MPTVTIFGNSADGNVRSSHGTYATARSGGGSFFATSTTGQVGQHTGYFLWEGMFAFDTSTVTGATATTLALGGNTNQSTHDFLMEARLHDWGTSITSADWVPGADLGSKPLLATWDTTLYSSGYNEFTEFGSAFTDNLNPSGETRILLCSEELRLGIAPTANGSIVFAVSEETGTAKDPKIVVTYSDAPVGGAVKIVGGATKPTKIFPGGVEKPVKLKTGGGTWELV